MSRGRIANKMVLVDCRSPINFKNQALSFQLTNIVRQTRPSTDYSGIFGVVE